MFIQVSNMEGERGFQLSRLINNKKNDGKKEMKSENTVEMHYSHIFPIQNYKKNKGEINELLHTYIDMLGRRTHH